MDDPTKKAQDDQTVAGSTTQVDENSVPAGDSTDQPVMEGGTVSTTMTDPAQGVGQVDDAPADQVVVEPVQEKPEEGTGSGGASTPPAM